MLAVIMIIAMIVEAQMYAVIKIFSFSASVLPSILSHSSDKGV